MMKFCEKLEATGSSFWDGKSKEEFSRIFVFFEETLYHWIEVISNFVEGNLHPVQQNKLAVLWAVIGCYSHLADGQESPSLLMEFINATDKLLMVESSKSFTDAYSLLCIIVFRLQPFVLVFLWK